MYPKQLGRLGLIRRCRLHRVLDHPFLENLNGLLEKEPILHQIIDKSVKIFLHA